MNYSNYITIHYKTPYHKQHFLEKIITDNHVKVTKF